MTTQNLRLKLTRVNALKLKVLPRFPVSIEVSNFLTLLKENGIYTFGIDYTKLDSTPFSDPATSIVALFDKTSGTYKVVSLAELQARSVREKLTSDRDYFVAPSGSDSNTGLSSAQSFKTIQHAIDVILKGIDSQGFTVRVLVADGTYTGAVSIGALVPDTPVAIQIVALGSGAVISTTSANCISASGFAQVIVIGFKLQTTTSGDCLNVTAGAQLSYSGINFGVSAGMHISINTYGLVQMIGNCTISGAAMAHIHIPNPSTYTAAPWVYTLVGTIAWGNYFVGVRAGYAYLSLLTFSGSGSATGERFVAHYGGVVDCENQSLDFLPGNSPGTVAGGGMYIGSAPVYSSDVVLPNLVVTGATLADDNVLLGTAGKQLVLGGVTAGTNAGVGAGLSKSVAANATLGTTMNTGLYILRDDTSGGSALIYVAVGEGVVSIIFQTGTSFVTTDPGSGASKWFISPIDGSIKNRFAATHLLTYTALAAKALVCV